MAVARHLKSYDDRSQHRAFSSPLYPYIMATAAGASRENQPASLATTATCTTLKQPLMRQLPRLIRSKSSDKKATATRATIFAILGPLVVYSLFQVTTNLILTPDHANNPHKQITRLQDSCPYYPSIKLTQTTQHYAKIFQSQSNTYPLKHSVRLNKEKFSKQHFYEVILTPLNKDETNYQIKQSSCSTSMSSQAEKIMASQCSPQDTSLLSRLESALAHLLEIFLRALERPIFGSKVLMAEAANAPNGLSAQYSKEIMDLNSTNFNSELIQYENPFPHIKLIEYYFAYCGVCLKFKPTYIELAREIFSWRNVIRMAAIDLGVSSNSPIAHSWSVDVVPTLRLHPPPSEEFAAQLAKQLSSWGSKLNSRDLQKSMYEEYNGTKLMINSLQVIKYTNDIKKAESTVADKVGLLKLDLLQYIERYVRENSKKLPPTWPNLKPVTERTLFELRKHHPRQELFLIIEAGTLDEISSDPNQFSAAGFQRKGQLAGLNVIMELSSSASWKAVRYVRASQNRELIEDVLRHKKREDNDRIQNGQTAISEQTDLLNNLITNRQSLDGNNSVLLVHIDFAHSTFGQIRATSSNFPFITIVTSSELITAEQFDLQQNGIGSRAKRAINQITGDNIRSMTKRSLFSSSSNQDDVASLKRKIDLMTLYINQTYTETKVDRDFVNAMRKLDLDPTSSDLRREVAEVSREISESSRVLLDDKIQDSNFIDDKNAINKSNSSVGNSSIIGLINRAGDSIMSLTTSTPSSSGKVDTNNLIYDQNDEDDYTDKLKAIRYIFFQEVPRKFLVDKSLPEQLEKLNTLLDLVAVIKTYFPLPDAASVKFIDGIQNYLLRQQQSLLNSMQTSLSASGNVGFDTKALKQELKRLESEDKRLPEIKEWKHCKFGGYSCALWRLFHTLTAFEHVKLSQINQHSAGPSQQVVKQLTSQIFHENQSTQNQKADLKPIAASLSSNQAHEQEQQNSPVERVVSPPSTTTSLSLTIATPTSSQHALENNGINYVSKRQHELDLLPTPVLLVMRHYVTQFFSCEDCARKFQLETEDLSFKRIRQQEPAEFSVLWLWETHNRVSKRLSINPETNPPEHPKKWFPSYNQCSKCYKRPPSYLKETNLELPAIFHESIEWDKTEVLNYLSCQYTRQPMDHLTNIFGYQVPYGIVVIITCSLLLIVFLRCASYYIERQRRYKASLLNGNGYSMVLQGNF